MSIFSPKPKCKKFFTYETRTLDVKGLTASVGSDKLPPFNFGLGEVSIKPQFVEATEKLKELDFLQYSICSNIQQLKDNDPNKPQLLKQLIETQIEMLKIAQNPITTKEQKQADNLKQDTSKNETDDVEITNLETTNETPNSRIEQLKIKIEENYKLLADWEQKRDLAENPTEIKRCETEIKRINDLIKRYTEEYEKNKNTNK